PLEEGNDITALCSSDAKGGSVHKNKRNFNMYCEFCKMKGHSKENCYQLIGYPADFNGRRKQVQGALIGHQHQRANAAQHGGFTSPYQARGNYNTEQTEAQSQGSTRGVTITFSPKQYNQILHIPNKENITETSANMAGTICSFLASKTRHSWIVDTGATYHMVSTHEMLFDLYDYP
ncbi:hypothetical protein A4A49_63591, partial [Nicotiana attenuata]